VFERARWRAEGAGPVHGGGPADAAALQDADGLVSGLAAGAFLVQRGIGLGFDLAEVAAALQRPFFDEYNLQAGGREQFGRDPGACAAADDGHIAVQFSG
jgi:hypothetical protein